MICGLGPPSDVITTSKRLSSSIPGTELAALAEAIRRLEPAIDRDGLKRKLAQLLGWSRYTAPLDKLLESVLPREA